MPLPKAEKIQVTAQPLALIVGNNDITSILSQKLRQGGCEVIETSHYPKSGKFNYIFQFGHVDQAKQAYLKFLKTAGKFLFIDYQNEDIEKITPLSQIKILRVGEITLWDRIELTDKILNAIFTFSPKSIIDIRKKGSYQKPSFGQLKKTSSHLPIKLDTFVQKRISRQILFPIYFFLLLVIAVIVFLTWQLNSIRNQIITAQKNFSQGNLIALSQDLPQISQNLNFTRSINKIIHSPYFPLRQIPYLVNLSQFLDAVDHFIAQAQTTSLAFQSIQSTGQSYSLKDINLSDANFQQLINSLASLSQASKNLKENTNMIVLPFFPTDSLLVFLDQISSDIDSMTKILPALKSIFVTYDPKTYLLLFQNNMELRPTGGFIGSVGFLTLQNGQVQDFNIMDVYTIDGQLKGHVEPPLPIRKYFNQPNWFLRDSNFDPDFAASSLQAQWFLQKTIGKTVDGVIGLNLFLVQDLLQAIGPINLADFNNEVITSDNLFIKAQLYIQPNFFEGSQVKKDFLTSLSQSIQKKLTGKNLPSIKVAKVFISALEQKNLLIYLNNQSLQTEVERLGWAGRLFNISCSHVESECLPDYLFLNEANFGVNKANYFVNKTLHIDKKINLSGQVITDLTINYHNQSLPQILQGGLYTNYLRIFLPRDSQIIETTFNDQKINPQDIDVFSYQQDKTAYGLLLKIPQNSQAKFKFSYLLPGQLDQDEKYYQFYFQKQPGDKISAISLSFAASDYQIKPLNFESVSSDKSLISLSSDTSVDRVFTVQLQR